MVHKGVSGMACLHIDAQADHVLRLAHTSDPVTAVIELVWNSLDAEANAVKVILERSDMDAIESVSVSDDGHGMAPEAIPSSFERLGGSWKARERLSPNIQRPMNGRYGRGRIRGFALGNTISWTTVADDLTGDRKRTVVSGQSSDPTNFNDEDSLVAIDDELGTTFLARNPPEQINRLAADTAIPKITAAFALFLTAYPNVTVTLDGHKMIPLLPNGIAQSTRLRDSQKVTGSRRRYFALSNGRRMQAELSICVMEPVMCSIALRRTSGRQDITLQLMFCGMLFLII